MGRSTQGLTSGVRKTVRVRDGGGREAQGRTHIDTNTHTQSPEEVGDDSKAHESWL